MISNLNILDTVELCITDKMLQKSFYRTKIQDISLDNIFYTMIPTSEIGRPVLFFKDRQYELYLKCSDGIILWNIIYLGTEKNDNILSLKFQAIFGPEKTQRREYFRQPVSVSSEFCIIDSESNENTTECNLGRIIDLSAGGCSMMSNKLVQLQTALTVQFVFRGVAFEFKAIVLDRIDYSQTKSDWDYKYRMSWFTALQGTKENLVRLVFEQQRELLVRMASQGRK